MFDEGAITDALDNVSDDLKAVGLVIIGLAGVALGIRWIKAMFF